MKQTFGGNWVRDIVSTGQDDLLNLFSSRSQARFEIRKGDAALVSFAGDPIGLAMPVPVAYELIHLVSAMDMRSIQSTKAITEFRDRFFSCYVQNAHNPLKYHHITVNGEPEFTYMTKGYIEAHWDRFQTRLPPEITLKIGQGLGIAVWPWVELAAKDCHRIRPNSGGIPHIVYGDFVHHRNEAEDEINRYGRPVGLMEGRDRAVMALCLPCSYLSDLEDLDGVVVKTVPGRDVDKTIHELTSFPPNEVHIVQDQSSRSGTAFRNKMLLVSAHPSSVIQSVLDRKNYATPLRISKIEKADILSTSYKKELQVHFSALLKSPDIKHFWARTALGGGAGKNISFP